MLLVHADGYNLQNTFFDIVMGGKNQSDMKQGKKGIPNGVPFFILNIIRV